MSLNIKKNNIDELFLNLTENPVGLENKDFRLQLSTVYQTFEDEARIEAEIRQKKVDKESEDYLAGHADGFQAGWTCGYERRIDEENADDGYDRDNNGVYNDGYDNGYEDGYSEGYDMGFADGREDD